MKTLKIPILAIVLVTIGTVAAVVFLGNDHAVPPKRNDAAPAPEKRPEKGDKNVHVTANPDAVAGSFIMPGQIGDTGVVAKSHAVKAEIPQIELRFLQNDGSGKAVPVRWRTLTIDLAGDAPARIFDVSGFYDLAYIDDGKRMAVWGVRFGIVRDDAEGYWEGANLFRFGRQYQIRFLEKGLKGQCTIKMPDSLEPGQLAVFNVRVDKVSAAEKKKDARPLITGKIDSQFPVGLPPKHWRVIYFDPETMASSEAQLAKDGAFSIRVRRMGGTLRIWPQTGWGVAWFQIQHLKKANVSFPEDAGFVSDPLKTRTVKVRIPKDSLPDFEKCVKKYAVFGLHHAAGEDVPVAIGKLFPDEWDKAVQAGIVEIPAVPGKYSLSGSFADGPHLLPMGQIVVPEKPAGVLEATP